MGVIRTYSKPRVCLVCGKPISSRKRSYCSVECSNKARVRIEMDRRKFARERGMEIW